MEKKSRILVWSAGLLLSTVCFGDLNEREPLQEESREWGISVAPLVGYEPTYKWVFGAAFFSESDALSLGADVNLNFAKVYQAHLNLTHRFAESLDYQVKVGFTKGFDPYYGEGGDTEVSSFQRLWGSKSDNRVQFNRRISSLVSMGMFTNVRIRTASPVEGEPFVNFFPNETTAALGIAAQVDTRKKKEGDGFLLLSELTYSPQGLSSRPNAEDFGQLESSFVVYQEILKGVFPEMVAAFQVRAGMTMGTPSYIYKYRLGGSDELKGYFDNRFRGKKYYMQQTELRFPIWKMFGGAASLAFGDATDSVFTDAKLAYGIGLRLGLPPDYVSKIRIDFAFGKDQSGIFADFGQSF